MYQSRVVCSTQRFCLVVATILSAASASLCAADSTTDGAYGRFTADSSFVPTLGGFTSSSGYGGFVDVRVRYLESIGLRGSFELGTAQTRLSSIVGVELRPLFLGRFLKGLETGPAFWDLLLDSVALELGIVATHGPSTNAGFVLGGAFEIPLQVQSNGWFLHVFADGRIFPGLSVATAGIGISFHLPMRLGLADLGDRHLR